MNKSTQQEINQATENMIVGRITLMMRHPFIGNLVSRLILKPTDEISSAATDGRSILFNPAFVNKFRKKEVEFLLGHEILHVILEHVGADSRLNGRDPKLWNISTDLVINLMLVEQGVGELPTTVPCLYDKKYTGLAAEQVYDLLLQENGGDSSGSKIDALADKLLDQHLSDSDDDPEGTKMTPAQRQTIKDDTREAMISAAHSCDPSSIPVGIKRLISDFTEPKLDWKSILQQQIESQVKSDFTYIRPSRRGWSCDAILPSMKKEPCVECTVAIDTSGSITNLMVKEFLSEVFGIMNQYSNFKVSICTWDTECYGYKEFDENNYLEIEDYQIHGGGGTDVNCVFNYFNENDITPKQLIVFTDMELFGSWGDDSLCDTIWLANKSNVVAPYGTTIRFG